MQFQTYYHYLDVGIFLTQLLNIQLNFLMKPELLRRGRRLQKIRLGRKAKCNLIPLPTD